MNVRNINNKIKWNISYLDFIRDDNGKLILKDSTLLTTSKSPDLVSFSSKGLK